ncbi:phosphodiester glycosidase family protein [Peptococcaceae bacterium 1198_IL3148]
MKIVNKIITALLILGLTAIAPGIMEAAQDIAPGVKYSTFETKNVDGKPLQGYVLEINPKQQLLEIRPVLGNDTVRGFETLSSLAQRHGAVAAINGGYFDGSGYPIGSVIIDGQTLTKSDMLRTSLGISKNGSAQIGYINPVMAVHLPNASERLLVDRLNWWPIENAVGVYTKEWGTTTPQAISSGVEIVIDENFVVQNVARGSIGYTPIPDRGYVIALWGDKAPLADQVSAGDKVTIGQFFEGDWQQLHHLLTAGPLLVEDGMPVFNGANEGFTGNILKTNPRTAVGIKENGNIIMVVIDGRQADYSAGVTWEELSYIMVDLGAVKAINLDGGGSSEMIVGGKIVNKPSDGKERGLSNAILVLYQIPVYMNGERLWFDVPPVLDNGRTLVPLRKIFETLGAEVEYVDGVVTAKSNTATITLTIDQREAMINDQVLVLDVPAKVVDGRTMVPLRFVGEAMGANVKWEADTKTVYIDNRGEAEANATN